MASFVVVLIAAGLAAQSATQPASETGGTILPAVTDAPSAAPAAAGSTARSAAGTSGAGTVTGDNVYVRAGFSTNYYPVIKLNRGDQVTIVDSEFGWLKILPPQGTFSLVEKSYVDKIDEKSGTINGSVWVYAGSDLSERNYAKQVKLERGARVRIVGEKEGFYKIEPPPGAHVWISGDFVSRGAGGATAKTSGIETVRPGGLSKAQVEAPSPIVRESRGKTATTRPAGLPRSPEAEDTRLSEEYQVQIRAIEAEITAEFAKPVTDQVLDPIMVKLEQLTQQDEDKIAKLYAETRLEQLRGQVDLIAAVREIRDLRQGAVATADEIARQRALMKVRQRDYSLDEIVCKGEILVSGLYDGLGGRPKRWRIVEPGTTRIVAYIEVPEGSSIDPVQYYGKYVGIRASARELLRNTIPPVPVYTVLEIKPLDPESLSRPTPLKAASMASPFSPSVETPTSQPAGSVDTSVEPK